MGRYDVSYYKCDDCGFIQTESPFWLKEAYSDAITDLDIGYVTRNLVNRDITSSVIKYLFHSKGRFIDYGGGYGLFVRLMRDCGYDFYRQDAFCENLFAKYFDINDCREEVDSFSLLTAFEVFEHLEQPIAEIEKMLSYSKSILFSTELQPDMSLISPNQWEYFSLETRQHISFYSLKSLLVIAEKYDLKLYSNGKNLHLLTTRQLPFNYISLIYYKQQIKDRLLGRNFNKKNSMLHGDYQYIKDTIS